MGAPVADRPEAPPGPRGEIPEPGEKEKGMTSLLRNTAHAGRLAWLAAAAALLAALPACSKGGGTGTDAS